MSAAAPILDLPAKHDSVLAAVAADLLENLRPTGNDCLFRHGSNRLSHHIYTLRKKRGWPIESLDLVVKTSDGRTEPISEYILPPSMIEAQGERATRFIEAVRKARAERRKAA